MLDVRCSPFLNLASLAFLAAHASLFKPPRTPRTPSAPRGEEHRTFNIEHRMFNAERPPRRRCYTARRRGHLSHDFRHAMQVADLRRPAGSHLEGRLLDRLIITRFAAIDFVGGLQGLGDVE